MTDFFQKTTKRGFVRLLSGLFILTLLGGRPLYGQRASLSGTVTDQSGRVLPDVRITLLNVDQGLQREVFSDVQGSFVAPWLQPGRYVISGQKQGFAVGEIKDVVLHVGDNRSIHLELVVGASPIHVEVDGRDQAVEMVNSAIGSVVTEDVIREAPLNGRNVLDLATLQPGVSPTNDDDSSPTRFNVSGNRSDSVTYLLDGGLDNNLLDNGVVYNPNPDTIAEFRILTSTYPAEFGRNSGGIVSLLTKSGGSHFHGSLFDFFRNDVLDANSYFNKTDPLSPLPRAPLKRNQFGGTLGGPIGRPGSGHRFFFVGYQGDRRIQGVAQHDVTTYTPAELKGDFSAADGGAPDPDVACFLAGHQPSQGPNECVDQNGNPLLAHSYFQPNPALAVQAIIDPTRINSVAMNYIKANLIPTSATGVLNTQSNARFDSDELTARADFDLTARDRLWVTFGWDRASEFDPYLYANVPGYAGNSYFGDWFTTAAYTHIFSPTLLNEFRAGFQRATVNQENPAQHLPTPADLGIGITPDIATGPTNLNFDFGALTVGNGVEGPAMTADNTFSYTDTLTWVRGRHNFKFGGGFMPFQNNTTFAFYVNGHFDFIGSGGIGSQNAFADFLLGIPADFTQSADSASNIRTKFTSAFAQDDFRVKPNLTLNLGVRYEYSTPKRDTEGRTFSIIPGLHSTRFPNAPSGMVFPGDPGAPEGVNFPDTTDWAARLGFAWDPANKGKTSLRGGFGIFYDLLKGEDNLQFNGQPPFYASAGLNFSPISPNQRSTVEYLGNPYGSIQFPNPFPSHPPPSNINFLDSGFLPIGASGSVFVVAPHLRTPYTYQYSLSLQQALPANVIAEAAYVGSSSHGLTSLIDVNPFVLGTPDRVLNLLPGNSSCSNAPNSPTCSYGALFEFRNLANASFNSLQLSLRKQFSSGHWFGHSYFTLAYTYSHNVDNTSGFRNRNNTVPSYQPGLFRSSADMDLRQRFVLSGGWELPFDQLWARAPHRVTHDWNLFPIVSYRSGFPLDVFANIGTVTNYTSPSPSGAGDPGNVHANLIAPVQYFDARSIRQFYGNVSPGNYWFDPTSFSNAQCKSNTGAACVPSSTLFPADYQVIANPALATYGSLSRNYLRAPARANFNLAVSKTTPLWNEHTNLEFRADFFNLPNRAQFRNPNTNISDASFGKLQSTYDPRIIQLALRLSF
jgi:hypothetical protein